MVGEIIQIFNRAPFPVSVMKDGRQKTIPAGYSYITSDWLRFAKQQNPVKGTEDPNSLQYDSLISYVVPAGSKQKQRDPLDTIPIEVLQALPKERINRNLLALDRQNTTELGTMFPRGRVGVEAPSLGMKELIQRADLD